MKLNLMCTAMGLIPMYDEDYDEKKKLSIGKVYTATIAMPRNIKFHRKYFAMINTAWEYLGDKQRSWPNVDAFRKECQIAAGAYEEAFSLKYGQYLALPKSISFEQMSEDEFMDLYNNVMDVITVLLVKAGVPVKEFQTMLEEFG